MGMLRLKTDFDLPFFRRAPPSLYPSPLTADGRRNAPPFRGVPIAMEFAHTMTKSPAQSITPLLVKPREAWRMLGCGNTRGYALLNARELESFLDGRSRKITVASIRDYIARKLAGADDRVKEAAPQGRRRGRPGKLPAGKAQ